MVMHSSNQKETNTSRKKWLVVQPKSNISVAIDSGRIAPVPIPLNLLIVATLANEQFDVSFVDERIGDRTPDDLAEYDIVAITVLTPFASRAYAIADRALEQGKRVILGGVHPTLMPEEASEHCTSVVVGEIEPVWDQLSADVQHDRLKSLYRSLILYPMTDMIHPDFSIAMKSKNAKRYLSVIPLVATRGCPVGCKYCSAPKLYGKEYRTRNVQHIIDEMKYHQDRVGKKNVTFTFFDDNICFKPAFIKELLSKMVGLGVKWTSNVSVNFLEDKGFTKLARLSGCERLNVGFESLTPESIKLLGKGTNRINRYRQAVENAHRQEIAILGFFNFGFDTDTLESFQATYDFIMQNQIEFPLFTLATPLPGTDWFEEMQPRLLHFNWDKYDLMHYMYKPAKMDQDELLNGFTKIQRKVYSLRAIYHRLKSRKIDRLWGINVGIHFFMYGWKPTRWL